MKDSSNRKERGKSKIKMTEIEQFALHGGAHQDQPNYRSGHKRELVLDSKGLKEINGVCFLCSAVLDCEPVLLRGSFSRSGLVRDSLILCSNKGQTHRMTWSMFDSIRRVRQLATTIMRTWFPVRLFALCWTVWFGIVVRHHA